MLRNIPQPRKVETNHIKNEIITHIRRQKSNKQAMERESNNLVSNKKKQQSKTIQNHRTENIIYTFEYPLYTHWWRKNTRVNDGKRMQQS